MSGACTGAPAGWGPRWRPDGAAGFSAASPASRWGCSGSSRPRSGWRGRWRACRWLRWVSDCLAGNFTVTPRDSTVSRMVLPHVAVVGAGQVGATTAHLLALKGLAQITLIDVVDGLAQGKALDMTQSAPIERLGVSVKGTTDFAALAGSRIIIITAGLARKPGMSRDDLLAANANIVGPIAERAASAAPEAILLVVTNPLDLMVALALQRSGFPRQRVMGMAGVLDSARLRAFVALRLGVPPSSVEAMVLGSHGDLMVTLRRTITVNGKPLSEQLPAKEIDQLLERTKHGGAEIRSEEH